MDNDRLDELKRRVDELAAVVAELLHANPELLGEHRKPGAGIPGPKEFTKKDVEDWFEERIRPVRRFWRSSSRSPQVSPRVCI